ncbi:hypothetical protein, partial [Pseudomonas aeruginosa]|uniref:hypothetical protein n=1 Tax=Pseudomonas aeruginosa TaxID=287 RepID=UPI002118DD48
LQRQDRESAERYWKERLAELDAPTRLAQAIRCELLPASGHGHFVHAFDPVSTKVFKVTRWVRANASKCWVETGSKAWPKWPCPLAGN